MAKRRKNRSGSRKSKKHNPSRGRRHGRRHNPAHRRRRRNPEVSWSKLLGGAGIGLGLNFLVDLGIMNISALSSIQTVTKDLLKLGIGGVGAYMTREKHPELAVGLLTAMAAEPVADGAAHLVTAAASAPPTGIVKGGRPMGIVKGGGIGARDALFGRRGMTTR